MSKIGQKYNINTGKFSFQSDTNETILNSGRKAGIRIPHTCGGQGKCRTCRYKIEEGQVSKPNSIEKSVPEFNEGYRLACQSYPLNDVKLDFYGPLKKGMPIAGNLELDSDNGLQLKVKRRGNSRVSKDRKLLVPLSKAINYSQGEMNRYLENINNSDAEDYINGALKPAPNFGSEGYSDEDYKAARRREKLLYFNIEFTNKCNLACTGCFAGFGDVQNVYDINDTTPGSKFVKQVEGPLVLEEIIELIDQAVDLGAKTVDLIGGGEPLISTMFFPIAEYAISKGLEVEVFTNGTLIKEDTAKRMAELKILPFVKLYSSRSWVHDEMVGKKNAWNSALKGIENLLNAGYGHENGLPIALETIVVRRNLQDIPTLWRWARENGMIPYFERFVGCHYDGDPGELLSSIELKDIWEELWLIDRGEYGYSWPLLPLRVGYTCATNFYSLYINYEGEVRPCSGVFMPLGDVRQNTLKEILSTSETIKDLREFERPLDSWCSNCFYHQNDRCPGCRGMAVTHGNHMSDDPLCFHNPKNLVH